MKGIICIGGREVGEKLARKLGIPCYDKLLIKKAALESGLSTDFISKTEESPINSIQFLSGNPYADQGKHKQTERQNTIFCFYAFVFSAGR